MPTTTINLHVDADLKVAADDFAHNRDVEGVVVRFGDLMECVSLIGPLHQVEVALGRALAELDRIRTTRLLAEEGKPHAFEPAPIELALGSNVLGPLVCRICGGVGHDFEGNPYGAVGALLKLERTSDPCPFCDRPRYEHEAGQWDAHRRRHDGLEGVRETRAVGT